MFFRIGNLLDFHLNPLKNLFIAATFPTTITTSKTTSKTTSNAEEQIKTLITENSSITAEELAGKIGISIEGVRYHIKNLKKKRIIKRIGGPKTGHWEITKP